MAHRIVTALFAIAILYSLSAHASESEDPSPEAVLAELRFVPGTPAERVIIDLAPEGAGPLVWMLDTGATASVSTPLAAREMGVRVRRLKSTPYRRPTVLGRELQFWIDTRSSDTGSKTGWEYSLLGGDFLDDYVLEIDFPSRRVRFLDPKRYQVPQEATEEGSAVVSIELTGNRVFASLDIDGKPVSVVVDTGAPIAILLSGVAARSVDIDPASLETVGDIGGVLGSTEVRTHQAGRVALGDIDFGEQRVLVAPRGFYNQGGSTDSLIGVELLQEYVVRIDYPRRRLWLKHVKPTGMAADPLNQAPANQPRLVGEEIEPSSRP